MDIHQDTVDEFYTGRGAADAVAKPIVASNMARKVYRYVRVRANDDNTIVIYVGPSTVTTTTGYVLAKTDEVDIPVENPSRVYVVATPASDCQQTVTLSGEVAGETFTLTFRGETTDPIAVNANAAAVQTALRALSTIGATGCSVADTAGGPPYTVTFTGPLAKTDVDLMTSTDGGISEIQNVTVTDALEGDLVVLTLGAESTSGFVYDATSAQVQSALEALTGIGAGNVSVSDGATGWDVEFIGDLALTDVDAMTGTVGKNELQTLTYLTSPVAGDMLTLTYDGNSAAPIAYDSTAAQVETALETIVALTGKVSVTDGDPSGYVIEFIDTLAGTDVDFVSGTCGKNEQQTIGIPDTVDTGTFTLTYDGQTTADIAYTATAADIRTALENLSNIEVDDVSVTGGAGPTTDWVVEFTGNLTRTDVPLMTATSSCGQNETQTIGIPDTTDAGTFTLTYDGQTTAAISQGASAATMQSALEDLSNIEVGDVEVTGGPGPTTDWVVEFKANLGLTDVPLMTATSSCGQNEKQTVAIDDASSGGTFTLTYDGQTTAGIAFDANAGAVQLALENLSNIEVGDVEVTGGPGPSVDWVVTFRQSLGLTDVPAMTGDGTSLTGGSTEVTITETVKGVTATVAIEETVKGVTEDVAITETVKGNGVAVSVDETAKGNTGTVTVTESQKGDEAFTITIAKVADITAGSKYSYLYV